MDALKSTKAAALDAEARDSERLQPPDFEGGAVQRLEGRRAPRFPKSTPNAIVVDSPV